MSVSENMMPYSLEGFLRDDEVQRVVRSIDAYKASVDPNRLAAESAPPSGATLRVVTDHTSSPSPPWWSPVSVDRIGTLDRPSSVVGDGTAGDSTVGDGTAGDGTAGDSTAGDGTAGGSTAGDPAGGLAAPDGPAYAHPHPAAGGRRLGPGPVGPHLAAGRRAGGFRRARGHHQCAPRPGGDAV